jgi:hypothetical protein
VIIPFRRDVLAFRAPCSMFSASAKCEIKASPAERLFGLPPCQILQGASMVLSVETRRLFERAERAVAESRRLVAERAVLAGESEKVLRLAEMKVYAERAAAMRGKTAAR